LAPWDIKIEPLTPYQQQLKKALEEYQSNILDPKEWSQDYPWFSSNVIKVHQLRLIRRKRHHLWMKKTIFTIQVMV
ncbi:hypothetical protein Golob_002495, partial [Gossypium lobatum]|nr:hypothetical protein [Gossypium lobatum]